MALYRRLYLRENFDDIDTAISDKIMDYYSNFAHTGFALHIYSLTLEGPTGSFLTPGTL